MLADRAQMHRSANKVEVPGVAAQVMSPHHGKLTQLAARLNARRVKSADFMQPRERSLTDNPPLQAIGLNSSGAVAQLYGVADYNPNLTGLTVPGGGGAAYSVGTFGRPAGWYEGTLDRLFALLPDDRKHRVPALNVTLVRCAVANTWHNINDMQIGHITGWAAYVQSKLPATVREATNAYNDLDNLRLESPTANASHDFEAGRESEAEDDSDSDDSFIDRSDGGIMDPEARKHLDEYKAAQSSTYT